MINRATWAPFKPNFKKKKHKKKIRSEKISYIFQKNRFIVFREMETRKKNSCISEGKRKKFLIFWEMKLSSSKLKNSLYKTPEGNL